MKKQAMFMILMILMTGVFATTIYIPDDYATIQEGINASENGDEIIVSPGTYVENINFAGKAVILGSLFYTTQDTSYISQTIIDGNQNGSVVTFESEEDSTSILTGFTITNGNNSSGGGIYCDSSSPSIDNVTITGNSASFGGGICCSSSNPILENVTITGNSAEDDGGGIYCLSSIPILVNVTLTGNSATSFESRGGGIYCNDSSPNLEDVTITDNSATTGGGIHCYSDSSPSLVNVTITGNLAVDNGGGIYCEGSNPSLMNVTITNNSADNGGGIYCWGSSPSLVNVTITDNSAVDDGGGINCYYSSSPSLMNVTISGNSAGQGGGITCINYSYPILENVTITGNSADYGGGICCWDTSRSILVNCILWNNSPQEVEFHDDYLPNTITIAYSDIDGGEEGIETNNNGTVNWLEGNIDADPLFRDAWLGDYYLSEDSPCIDAGIAYFEYEGEVLVDLSEDEYWGIAPDMGAFEYGLVNTDEFIIQNSKLNIQNYPNPFNPETNIVFELSFGSNVLIEIYNI